MIVEALNYLLQLIDVYQMLALRVVALNVLHFNQIAVFIDKCPIHILATAKFADT